jgi:hypothetical protein
MQPDQRRCEHCSSPIVYTDAWTPSRRARTRFCSRACAALVAHRTDGRSRFEKNIIPEPMSGCWLWLGTISTYGYGQMKVNGTLFLAHRLSFELHNGPISPNAWILHGCDNRLCVNPEHLYLGDHIRNMRDMVERGRARTGSLNHNTKLTVNDVRAIRGSDLSNAELALRYSVSRTAIRLARTGVNWRHVA